MFIYDVRMNDWAATLSGGVKMAIWQWALLALGAVWMLQVIGVWLQMRHYTDVFKGITSKYNDGYVGAGHARGRLRRGTIALLVVGQDMKVQRLMTMTGRSVFAKFKRNEQYEGQSLNALKAAQAVAAADNTHAAISKAIEQVEHVREGKGPAAPRLRLASA